VLFLATTVRRMLLNALLRLLYELFLVKTVRRGVFKDVFLLTTARRGSRIARRGVTTERRSPERVRKIVITLLKKVTLKECKTLHGK